MPELTPRSDPLSGRLTPGVRTTPNDVSWKALDETGLPAAVRDVGEPLMAAEPVPA